MGFTDFSGIVIDHTRKFITNPVDEQFLARLTFLRKYDLFTGSILPGNVLSAEPAITVTIRMLRAVIILSDILEVGFAAGLQLCMDALPIRQCMILITRWIFLSFVTK